ncbi:unnamed protein product [Rotaria sp. Silwood2]|nr:unnamed protein product [Rotaria sp. Silwood2]CAF4381432.1 unnamed protein product [Rotaria sp. Silwood2]
MDLIRRYRFAYLVFLILPYLFIIYSYFFKSSSSSSSINNSMQIKQSSRVLISIDVERVLVIYVWADTDVQAVGNLQFFIRYGVHPSQPADYYFILQQVNNKTVNESRLPILPSNAHYIQHINECYDFGTIGWFLSQNITNTTLYKYFIFMNSSVRGPFFATYFDSDAVWWFTIFTKRLNDDIKLVGCTISCAHSPHVQSYLLVTDQIGFAILIDKKNKVFNCKNGYNDAIVNGEIATSQLILHANYQIASLQTKYQGWDFRNKENWGCNNKVSPIFLDRAVDGISHDPYELIFVKYKGLPPFDTDLERRALVYQKWLVERPEAKQKN